MRRVLKYQSTEGKTDSSQNCTIGWAVHFFSQLHITTCNPDKESSSSRTPPSPPPRQHRLFCFFLPWESCLYHSKKANNIWSVRRRVVCLYQQLCRFAGNIPMNLIKCCICRQRSSCLKHKWRQLFQWEFYHLRRSFQQIQPPPPSPSPWFWFLLHANDGHCDYRKSLTRVKWLNWQNTCECMDYYS